MAKETQKAKIERLENELSNAYNIIQKLNNEISEMIEKADNSFENSSTYKQMAKKIEGLELKVKVKEGSAAHNRKMYEHELKVRNTLINESVDQLSDVNIDILQEQLQEDNNRSDKWQNGFYNKEQECKKLKDEIQKLNNEKEEYINIIEKLKNKNIQKLKNERGAGRKREITEEERQKIKEYRSQDMTIKEIAELFGRSVGIVHKIINEK